MLSVIGRSLLLGLVIAAGCGPKRSAQDYIPAEEAARQALEKSLAAWKGGRTPDLVQEAGPQIRLVDSRHKTGQTLAAFAILGPSAGDAARCYAVRLTFADPAEEVRARFVVFGLDPLWVMRYEDYEMLTHWDHGPMTSKKSAP